MFLVFPLLLVFLAFSAFLVVEVITRASDLCLPYNYSPAYSLSGFVCYSWTAYLCTELG